MSQRGHTVSALRSDMDQEAFDVAVRDFRTSIYPRVLITTDRLGRGVGV